MSRDVAAVPERDIPNVHHRTIKAPLFVEACNVDQPVPPFLSPLGLSRHRQAEFPFPSFHTHNGGAGAAPGLEADAERPKTANAAEEDTGQPGIVVLLRVERRRRGNDRVAGIVLRAPCLISRGFVPFIFLEARRITQGWQWKRRDPVGIRRRRRRSDDDESDRP